MITKYESPIVSHIVGYFYACFGLLCYGAMFKSSNYQCSQKRYHGYREAKSTQYIPV